MKHLGDISGIKGSEIDPVDIITFGSPCQDMSVAGKRSGLDGERSSLFYQAVRIVKEMRCKTNGKYPRFVVWENVPGVLNTPDNAFGAFLGGLCGRDAAISEPADGWTGAGVVDGPTRCAAWRTLDAQHFGLRTIYPGEAAGRVLEVDGIGHGLEQGFELSPVGDLSAKDLFDVRRDIGAFQQNL